MKPASRKPVNEDTAAKARTIVSQLLEGPADWKMSKGGNRAVDRLAGKMNAAASRLDNGPQAEPPFWIDAEFAGDIPGDIAKAKRMAVDFGLKFVKADMNGNPAVHGKLNTVAEVRAFARRYGSKAVFEPGGRRGGTEVFFE